MLDLQDTPTPNLTSAKWVHRKLLAEQSLLGDPWPWLMTTNLYSLFTSSLIRPLMTSVKKTIRKVQPRWPCDLQRAQMIMCLISLGSELKVANISCNYIRSVPCPRGKFQMLDSVDSSLLVSHHMHMFWNCLCLCGNFFVGILSKLSLKFTLINRHKQQAHNWVVFYIHGWVMSSGQEIKCTITPEATLCPSVSLPTGSNPTVILMSSYCNSQPLEIHFHRQENMLAKTSPQQR